MMLMCFYVTFFPARLAVRVIASRCDTLVLRHSTMCDVCRCLPQSIRTLSLRF
jgi:hypothetical protein